MTAKKLASAPTSKKIERQARLHWVPLNLIRVSPRAQRDLNEARVDHIAQGMDLEQIGTPTVSERGGYYYVLDGQHRINALIKWLGSGWDDQTVQCWSYTGLAEEDEAEIFLKLNDVLPVPAMARFKVAVKAGRPIESDIDRIVRAQGLFITMDHIEGAIRAVGTVKRVYEREGPGVLARCLGLIRDAYGTAGFEAAMIDGMGFLCGRYNGDLDIPKTVERLSNAHGGVAGLLNKAEVLRRQTGNPKAQCVAAAAVELINRGRGGPKLPSWWKAA